MSACSVPYQGHHCTMWLVRCKVIGLTLKATSTLHLGTSCCMGVHTLCTVLLAKGMSLGFGSCAV